MGAVKTILAMGSNMKYAVKIREAASKFGATTILVDSSEEMVTKIRQVHPSLLIFDLTALLDGWQEAVSAAKSENVPIIAFGPHDNETATEEAVRAGIDQVYANSKFTLELPTLLENALTHA